MNRILLVVLMFFCFHLGHAEGTKQILLSDGGHGKVQVMQSFSNFAWYTAAGNSAPVAYRLHIHVENIGEKIYYGFGDLLENDNSVFGIQVNYRIKNPAGTIVVGPSPVPTSGAGYISTFSEAVAGPSAVAGAGGYNALSYTPATTGDYFIEFNYAGGFGSPDRCKFKYFDITVGSAANTAIDGRVWSYAWQFTADDNGTNFPFEGSLFVYTSDSIVTSINFNGMAPYVFTIACNQYGCYNTGNFINDRRSVPGNHILTQYKIFLNDPDIIVYPTGTLGQILPPVLTTTNCDGTVNIQLTVNKSGNADVWLDINPAPGVQPEDRVLSSVVNAGVNFFNWDGLDGFGLPVPNGTVITIRITYINGLTNLPIYDIDQNPNGFIIDLQRPSGPVPGVFWDDVLVGGTQNIITGCIYSLPSTGCHTVPLSVGNSNTINTWWYAVVDSSLAPITITEKRTPQPLGAITGLTALCPGTNSVMYFVPIEVNSQTYQWSFSGGGATINGNGNDTVYIDFSGFATSGVLTVTGFNDSCGFGPSPSSLNITLLPFPNVTLAAYTPVCLNTPPFNLFGGAPAGGTYTVSGIPVVLFDPSTYGTGSHPVTYTYSDPFTNCTKSVTQPLVVNSLPNVTVGPVAPVCENAPPFLLTGGTPAGGIYSGPGISGGSNFNPATAGPGNHQIIYTYTDINICTSSDTTTITVYDVTPAALIPFADVCVNSLPFALSGGTPAGGIYTGNGVTGGIFDPSSAGPGIHLITYTYTNANGCIDFTSLPITVLPLPGPAGAISGPSALCQGATGQVYSTTLVTNVVSYQWTMVPLAAGTISGSSTSVTIDFNAGFAGPVQLFVTGVNGCGNGASSPAYTVTIQPKPVMAFQKCTDSVTLTTAQPFFLKGGIPLGGVYSGTGVNSVTGLFSPNVAGPGLHTIFYTYVNTYGCAKNISRTIRVLAPAAFSCGNPVLDVRDGKSYPSVLIGIQCWMAANLNYGTSITSAVVQRDNCIIEKYCYGDNPAACTTNGGLYQWDELMSYRSAPGGQGLCPPSWHVPTEADWNQLFSFYISNGFAGSPLKSTGYSGFNILLSGADFFNRSFSFTGFATIIWSSTAHGSNKAWAHGMNSYDPSVSFYPSFRANAFSVRCIKD